MRIAALLALAAVAAPLGAQVPTPNSFSDRLAKLPPLQRNAVLRRALLDSNSYCKRIEGGQFQQSYKNLKMWTTRCDGKYSYAVFIGPDASVQARPCNDMARLKLPLCRPAKYPPLPPLKK